MRSWLFGMPGVFRVGVGIMRAVLLVQLLGAVRSFEFVALTGNAKQ